MKILYPVMIIWLKGQHFIRIFLLIMDFQLFLLPLIPIQVPPVEKDFIGSGTAGIFPPALLLWHASTGTTVTAYGGCES